MTNYIRVNQGMLNAFVERWHTETSPFHLSLGEMSITLDDLSCLLYLLIRGKLLDHWRVTKDEALEMMVDYMRVNPKDALTKIERTTWGHARFEFLKRYIKMSS